MLKPKKGLEAERAEKTKQELAKYKASLSDAELDKLVESTKALKKYQKTPDTAEALKTIPLFSLKECVRKVIFMPDQDKSESEVPVLTFPEFTNKIVYLL